MRACLLLLVATLCLGPRLAFAAAPFEAPTGPNLLRNPGFEEIENGRPHLDELLPVLIIGIPTALVVGIALFIAGKREDTPADSTPPGSQVDSEQTGPDHLNLD